jgi:hypothetical protein
VATVATQATGLKVELFEGVGGGNQYWDRATARQGRETAALIAAITSNASSTRARVMGLT